MRNNKSEMRTAKTKLFFNYSLFIGLLGVLGILILASITDGIRWTFFPSVCALLALLATAWMIGGVLICVRKNEFKGAISKSLIVLNGIVLSGILGFGLLYVVAINYDYKGLFSTSTTLFADKKVMFIVPHQDDDINLAGGLIEQYTGNTGEVTVVFSTNGDFYGKPEIRAVETVKVLTDLGVRKENIYYLGFDDQWCPQAYEDRELGHIYSSVDADAVWTSIFGATATYGAQAIDCYLELPYTRNNFLYSLQNIILEKRPDVIFAVDFDEHIDHKATGLLFEEALCKVLKMSDDYNPTVYKGFCYETAWTAPIDYFDSLNLLSSQMPDIETWEAYSLHYDWEKRVRFPIDSLNLNLILSRNTVYKSLDTYSSQLAVAKAKRVLNGDKVFWERRTDSLLYEAEIQVGGVATNKLNDFKLKDFDNINARYSENVGVVYLQGNTVNIRTMSPIKANSIYLYDNPHKEQNILKGYIVFDGTSRIDFGPLNKDGSLTEILFPEKVFQQIDIVVTESEGDDVGLSEVEAYYDLASKQRPQDTCLMAVDEEDNFVYDYILQENDTVKLKIYSVPDMKQLRQEDIGVYFDQKGKNASYHWEEDTLIVYCDEGNLCEISVSDEKSSTTFTIRHPGKLTCAYLKVLRNVDRAVVNINYVIDYAIDFLVNKLA